MMGRSEPPRLSVILVNWNTRELFVDSVRRLVELAPDLDAELIAVDNASTDGSAEAIQDRFPQVALIRNRENHGFARAANQGILRGTGAIVALLNPDVEVDDEALRRCLTVIEADPRIGALGPLLMDGTGKPWQYADRFPGVAQEALRALLQLRSRGHLSRGRPFGPDLREVDWLAGACLFLRRDVLTRIGLLDERFFLYWEDVDLCRRLREAGYRVVRHHGARMRHGVAQSVRRNPGAEADRARIEGLRGSVLYARKHQGELAARILAASLRLSLLPRIVKASLLAAIGHEKSRRKARWMRAALLGITRSLPGAAGQKEIPS